MPPCQSYREQMGLTASPMLPRSFQVYFKKQAYFPVQVPLFHMPNPSTWKRGQLTQKYRRPHVSQESPCDRGCLLTFPQIPEVFHMGSQPGSCLARTQHHSPNSSKISWKAPRFSCCSPSSCPTVPLSTHPGCCTSNHSPPSLPSRTRHDLTPLTLAAGAFRAASLLQHTSANAGASCTPPPSEPGPLGTRHGLEACEDMVSCLGEIPSPETRACRAKHSCKWHSEPREARL